jgi:large repetitive protein
MMPGTYRLTETQPIELLDGADRAGTLGGVAGNDVIRSIVVGVNKAGKNYEFGERGLDPNYIGKRLLLADTTLADVINRTPGSGVADVHPIGGDPSGSVYVDLNHNGKRDAGEPGIAGVVITLRGTTSAGVAIALVHRTDAAGNYHFDNLPPASTA